MPVACAALRASRTKRSTSSRVANRPARSILMATMRPNSVSRARNTWPKEPRAQLFEELKLAEAARGFGGS